MGCTPTKRELEIKQINPNNVMEILPQPPTMTTIDIKSDSSSQQDIQVVKNEDLPDHLPMDSQDLGKNFFKPITPRKAIK